MPTTKETSPLYNREGPLKASDCDVVFSGWGGNEVGKGRGEIAGWGIGGLEMVTEQYCGVTRPLPL